MKKDQEVKPIGKVEGNVQKEKPIRKLIGEVSEIKVMMMRAFLQTVQIACILFERMLSTTFGGIRIFCLPGQINSI